ncbi:hypothetical protein FSP39_021107 [Pinctada imbricata]|uniref:DRBM domain-containing protein n=1 Tax=Pinctada imbricata TaxID=66713 RepID=A0AA89CBE7_PINIB|nr:hypothetical protein FSP39_021107 [Pinctada imbricata]
MYIMGKLNCVGLGDKTQRGKERKRKRYAYYHQGHEICKGAFMLLHGESNKYVKNIVAHMNENGNVPRVHKNKNRRPANAFSFDELKHALNYIMHYAEEVGLPQPMVRGKGNPVVFLPSSGSKSDLHKQYVASCEEAGIRHLGLTSFKLLWKDCCPHIKFMSPMSDMGPKCEEHRDAISKAVSMEQKQEAVRLFSEHLTIVQKEREVYNKSVGDARVEMTDYVRPAGVIPPCSANLTKVHYTMDFSQAVSVPHRARQEGPLYFLVPRKLQLFGIAVEGIFRQFNYVIDEDQTIGENGTGIKGPNGVISMLHHCLQQNGFGEEECIIHCDNCAGISMAIPPGKTPISFLQEICTKRGITPQYDLIANEGAVHEPVFQMRVTVGDVLATGKGTSKKKAKHAAAHNALRQVLGLTNGPETEQYGSDQNQNSNPSEDGDLGNPVGELQEFTQKKLMKPPVYEFNSEQGPPHNREFVCTVKMGKLTEKGTGRSKKAAKRTAASLMLIHVRNLTSEGENKQIEESDEEDEIPLGASEIRSSYTTLKEGKVKVPIPNAQQNKELQIFYQKVKKNNKKLKNSNLSAPATNYCQMLQEIAEVQRFEVSYIDIAEKSVSGQFQCLVQLSTMPIAVCHGTGTSIDESHAQAAHNALQYLRLMTKT